VGFNGDWENDRMTGWMTGVVAVVLFVEAVAALGLIAFAMVGIAVTTTTVLSILVPSTVAATVLAFIYRS
jgi:hypothetical protein